MKKLKLISSCNARAKLDDEILRQLAITGLPLLLLGFESGAQDLLDRMKKGLRLETARAFMRNCASWESESCEIGRNHNRKPAA